MEIKLNNGYEYIEYKIGSAKALFFTAENGADFSLAREGTVKELNRIKDMLKLDDIGYNRQIHSDIINVYDGNIIAGDALISDRNNVAVGVFTADCVPVLIYDSKHQKCAAVHSGWRGTYSRITSKTIERMKALYGTSPEDVHIIVGPHIKSCCYEVSSELINTFKEDSVYDGYDIALNNHLDLELCVKAQCLRTGVLEENIILTGICTHCNEEFKLHSYRRDKDNSGRLFSLIYI